jgi:acetyl-CoA carboxylase biotin carboxyl carrier protein
MTDAKITQQDLDAILKLIESAEHVAEFHLKYGDLEVSLSRSAAPAAQPSRPLSAPAAETPRGEPEPKAAAAPKKAQAVVPPGMVAIKSPMVGTFYRAPSPGAKPFVEIGQKVDPGSVVCIIEVMKLMNSIPAGVSGTIRQILVNDAQPVQFAQVLIVIEPAK